MLLVPLYMVRGQPLGTLWVVSEEEGHFDSGHAGMMRELASFVGIALAMLHAQQLLQDAAARQEDTRRALQAVVAEKELLVQEAHHRVKNSLQMLQGLLLMQAKASAHPEVAQELRQSAVRINTFGAMHEQLYRVGADVTVDLAVYLGDLVAAQKEALASTLEGRDIALDAAPVRWPASSAPSIGLIVLELITNALKHGAGTVAVTLGQTGTLLTLRVEDDGQALAAGYEPAQSKGLGMRVVQGLLRGLRGRLAIDRSRGHTCFVAMMQAPEA
jgi:two-component sensor histidine kinase